MVLKKRLLFLPSIKKMNEFHRKRAEIDRAVISEVKKGRGVIYGGKALNEHLPPFLDRHTEDYDVFVKNPEQKARRLERRLDRKFGADLFAVVSAQHEGTFKVKNRVTEGTIADFTRTERKIPSVRRRGVMFASLPFIESGLRKELRSKSAEYRHARDRDALNRIAVMKSLKKRKRRRAEEFFPIPTRLGW